MHHDSDRVPESDPYRVLGNQLAVFTCDKALDETDGDIDATAAIVAAAVGQAMAMGVYNLTQFHHDPDAAQAFLYAVMNEAVRHMADFAPDIGLTGFLVTGPTYGDDEPLDDTID